eukprot:CAMPEP_0172856592 /NCGR_PEP_ID=MMETSP1075-20121228/64130_1 /TAXON_ID=2916 /ORGANISM="Ceratium fusus, Strain PA161109" /LENGTH=263 /DNA_ID=CAMNT_0013703801 /DNA_START=42 /DNA_END=830 /DNA_ORIENTATION=+
MKSSSCAACALLAAVTLSLQGCENIFVPYCKAGPVELVGILVVIQLVVQPNAWATHACVQQAIASMELTSSVAVLRFLMRPALLSLFATLVAWCPLRASMGIASAAQTCTSAPMAHATVVGGQMDQTNLLQFLLQTSTLAQVEALSAADAQEDREIALNVVLGVLSIAAPTSALLASLAAMTQLFRRSAARKGLLVTEEAGPSYEKLLGSPSSWCKDAGQRRVAATGAKTIRCTGNDAFKKFPWQCLRAAEALRATAAVAATT